MKQQTKSILKHALSAILAAAMLTAALAGCASPQSGTSSASSAEASRSAEPAQSQEPDAGTLSGEPQDRPALPDGFLQEESGEIADEEGTAINQAVADMQESYRADPLNPAVTERNWRAYASSTAKEKLNDNELTFYNRLDNLCRQYISDDSLDGVKNAKYNCYVTDRLPYSDLGLTSEQAGNIFWWFKYNNPQYYFIRSGWIYDSQAIYPKLYDFAADAVERAKITNELFDKLDGWIETANASGSTSWQKELAANNLLCKHIRYDDNLINGQNNSLGQSLYSAVTLEGTVCAGYAEAFCAMMNAMGIDTMVVLSKTHAWNVTLLGDGSYYAVDVTWNDNKNDDDQPYNTYFNVGEQGFARDEETRQSHTYETCTTAWGQTLPRQNYVPGAEDFGYNPIQLAAPTNAEVYKTEATVLCYSWEKAADVDSYECVMFTDASYDSIRSRGIITGASVKWSDLTPGTDYYFGVRSFRSEDGRDYYSDWVYLSAATAAR